MAFYNGFYPNYQNNPLQNSIYMLNNYNNNIYENKINNDVYSPYINNNYEKKNIYPINDYNFGNYYSPHKNNHLIENNNPYKKEYSLIKELNKENHKKLFVSSSQENIFNNKKTNNHLSNSKNDMKNNPGYKEYNTGKTNKVDQKNIQPNNSNKFKYNTNKKKNMNNLKNKFGLNNYNDFNKKDEDFDNHPKIQNKYEDKINNEIHFNIYNLKENPIENFKNDNNDNNNNNDNNKKSPKKHFNKLSHKKDKINKNLKCEIISTKIQEDIKTQLLKILKKKINFKENSYEAKDIKLKIASLYKETKINKLKINLIFFYENLSDEDVNFNNRLKLEVLGGYFGIRKVNIFKTLLNGIQNLNSPFTLISIGSSFEKINNLCNESKFIKNIIIYCMDVNKYKNLYDINKKVKLITADLDDVLDKLKEISNKNHEYDENLKNLMNHNLLISYYEYKNYYYIHHKILSFFFKKDFSILNFSADYMEKVFNFVDHDTKLDENQKKELKERIEKFKDSKTFLDDMLEFYTSESKYVYLFNKTMRNIEIGMERLSFLIGPMYYAIVRFLVKYPDLMLKERKVLYRNIYINEYDLETYLMTEGSIICFPSFTSTSIKKGFCPTSNALNVNYIKSKKILLNMVLTYEYKYKNIPQGMYLKFHSSNPHEEEILLFPFTFIKVESINEVKKAIYELKGKIINKDSILEFGLRKGKKVILKEDVLTLVDY